MTAKRKIQQIELSRYRGKSIAEIELIMNDIKVRGAEMSAEKMLHEMAVARKALHERMYDVKAKAAEFEQTNYEYILFYGSTHGFYKVIGNSLALLAVNYKKQLGWQFNVRQDTDHYNVMESGVISLKSLTGIEERMMRLGIKSETVITEEPDLHFYRVPRKFSKEAISRMREELSASEQQLLALTMVDKPDPEIYDKIMQVNEAMHYKLKQAPACLTRDVIGGEILKTGAGMLQDYMAYARRSNNERKKESLLRIGQAARKLQDNIILLCHLRVLSSSEMHGILEMVVMIAERVMRLMKKTMQTVQ